MLNVRSHSLLMSTLLFMSPVLMSPSYAANQVQNERPEHFVYLRDFAPSILQDIRYAGNHNFVGRPLPGYDAAECVLTLQAAYALAEVQAVLATSNLSLKVYDCYRPVRAVYDFFRWSLDSAEQTMKAEFYPNIDKSKLFELNYLNQSSTHSRGSTVDLTIVALPAASEPEYQAGQALTSCVAPKEERFADNSLDMGTGYDCFDDLAHPNNSAVSELAAANRKLLAGLMQQQGFVQSHTEWWHFRLKNEPYVDTYFDFPIQKRAGS